MVHTDASNRIITAANRPRPGGSAAARSSRASQENHDEEVGCEERDARRQVHPGRFRASDDGDDGEQTPGAEVVDGGTGNGKQAGARVHHLAVGQNPRQDGESGDAHSGAEEEDKRQLRGAVSEPRIERDGEEGSGEERRENTSLAGDNDGPRGAADCAGLDFQSNQEHEKDEAYLAECIERGEAGRGEEGVHRRRGDSSEERRAEQEAGRHLAYDPGLPDEPETGGYKPGRQQHHQHLEEEQLELRHCRVPSGGARRGAAAARARGA